MCKTFIQIIKGDVAKFNPYHDRLGRFSTAGGATSMTYRPGASAAHDNAIARAKEQSEETNSFSGRLYHGSPNKDIEELDIARAGSNVSSGEKLLFFTDSKQMADDFSYQRLEGSSRFSDAKGEKGRVYEVDVKIKKPLDLRNLSDKDIDNIKDMANDDLLTSDFVRQCSAKNNQLLKPYLDLRPEVLSRYGYDGFIANAGKGATEYAVISNEQAKIVR